MAVSEAALTLVFAVLIVRRGSAAGLAIDWSVRRTPNGRLSDAGVVGYTTCLFATRVWILSCEKCASQSARRIFRKF